MKRIAVAKLLPVDQAPPFAPVVVAGMKALQHGQASEQQQIAVFNWLLEEAAGIGSQCFRANDPYATAFMDGRRFVGIQMMMLLQQKVNDDG